MATISLCMIVKDEEKNLDRCLATFKGIADEMIIVDTGSSDKTKEIAAKYTENIYDFEWIDDFAAARNFAFSKATMDYIYSADADEHIDEENRQKLLQLKSVLMPEIEIVQMIYSEEEISTVLNSTTELRPKLYKRCREFNWIDPVHETVRTLPVVYDSDIRIDHRPEGLHAHRDFRLIEKAYKKEGQLSKNLYSMYATEVYKWGDAKDLFEAAGIFEEVIKTEEADEELFKKLALVIVRSSRISRLFPKFLKYTAKLLALCECSETCCELGDYFFEQKDFEEAEIWYYNALYETESLLDADSHEKYPQAQMDKLKQENKS